MVIKLDIKNVYDRLGCDFVKKFLTNLSFSDKWTNWIMECITTTFLTILVNGKLGVTLNPWGGIRQD